MGVAEKIRVTQELKILDTGTTLFAPLECQGIVEYGGLPHIACKRTDVFDLFY